MFGRSEPERGERPHSRCRQRRAHGPTRLSRVGDPEVRVIPSHICYICGVERVPSRELRNETRRILQRVEAGEDVIITVDGREVAILKPMPSRKRWQSGPALFHELVRIQADPGLSVELEALVRGTTDEITASL